MQHFVVVVNITLLLQTFVGQLDGGEGIKANRCGMLCSRFLIRHFGMFALILFSDCRILSLRWRLLRGSKSGQKSGDI